MVIQSIDRNVNLINNNNILLVKGTVSAIIANSYRCMYVSERGERSRGLVFQDLRIRRRVLKRYRIDVSLSTIGIIRGTK